MASARAKQGSSQPNTGRSVGAQALPPLEDRTAEASAGNGMDIEERERRRTLTPTLGANNAWFHLKFKDKGRPGRR
jgi:hypothetical protein